MPTAASPALLLERDAFQRNFEQRPFTFRHTLSGHPLFELRSLVELARTLSDDSVEYYSGDVPIGIEPDRTPRTGLSVEETIRRIEECNSWMVLRNVQQDPRYAALMDACLDQIKPYTEQAAPGMYERQAWIFISSAGATTPFHIDPEHNFLLQIRGDKVVHTFPREDAQVLQPQSLEAFYRPGGHRNLPWQDSFMAQDDPQPLAPGQVLHLPVTVPHWVKVGSSWSVSFSITFRSETSRRREWVCRINDRLRQAGMAPTPFGHSRVADGAKIAAFQALRGLKRLAGKGTTEAARPNY